MIWVNCLFLLSLAVIAFGVLCHIKYVEEQRYEIKMDYNCCNRDDMQTTPSRSPYDFWLNLAAIFATIWALAKATSFTENYINKRARCKAFKEELNNRILLQAQEESLNELQQHQQEQELSLSDTPSDEPTLSSSQPFDEDKDVDTSLQDNSPDANSDLLAKFQELMLENKQLHKKLHQLQQKMEINLQEDDQDPFVEQPKLQMDDNNNVKPVRRLNIIPKHYKFKCAPVGPQVCRNLLSPHRLFGSPIIALATNDEAEDPHVAAPYHFENTGE